MNRKLHYLYCGLRDLFGLAPPNARQAINRMRIDEAALREEYFESKASTLKDEFVLYRIVGNDLPPRHERGQSLRNLRFILENESELPFCAKRFLLNRIVDQELEGEVSALLDSHGCEYTRIPFHADEYVNIPLDFSCLPNGCSDYLNSRGYQRLPKRHKIRLLTAVNRLRNNYVMHNNGARNIALNDGRPRAKWVLPFDGNCFFTQNAWVSLLNEIQKRPWLKYFVVPMARIKDNSQLLDREYAPSADEEPQLVFRSDATGSFNEAFPYGRFPKIEMFWHLGIPGPWSYTCEKAWDPTRRSLSPEAYQFGLAGWVARLYSGVGHLEKPGHDMGSRRGDARREAILNLLAELDRKHMGACRFEAYEQII